MKITITLNGVRLVKDIPASWKETTFRQLVEVSKLGSSLLKILSYFTGIEERLLEKAMITNLEGIIPVLNYLNTMPELTVPSKILNYDIPKDLGLKTIGQLQDVKNTLTEATENSIEHFPLLCAIYACPGEYDWQRAEAMKDEFFNAPALEVLAVGHFTMLKLVGLTTNKRIISHLKITRLKKFKLVTKGLLLRLGFILRYSLWKKRQAISAEK
jgi:hypothetical protein